MLVMRLGHDRRVRRAAARPATRFTIKRLRTGGAFFI